MRRPQNRWSSSRLVIIPPPPRKEKKFRWWLVPLAILAVLLVGMLVDILRMC